MIRQISILVVLLAGGCASIEPGAPPVLSPRGESGAGVNLAPILTPSAIALRDALALALTHNPKLGVLALEAEALAGVEIQAGLLPNPNLSVDVENFGRSRKRLGQLNGPEYTLAVGQLVELGGKRAARVRAAKLDRRLSLWDYEETRLEILARTASDFVALLTAQEEEALAREGARAGEQTYDAVAAKIDAGKVSPIEESRALVLRTRSRLQIEHAAGRVASARARLAANWGGAGAGFERAVGALSTPEALPELGMLQAELATHPAVTRWLDEVERRREELNLARAQRIPDPTLSGGARFLDETDESAFLLGLSLPLPIFDRNQGGILAADRRVAAALATRRATFIDRRATLTVAYEAAKSARRRALVIETEILPASRKAFDGTRDAYAEGKFGLTDVLETERAWFGIRTELLEALREYHARKAELEALIGRPMNEISSGADE